MGIILDIANDIAKELQLDIDWQLMSEVLQDDMGWYKVQAPFNVIDKTMDIWLKKNIKGVYYNRHFEWLFKNADDATLFTLRWT